MKSSTIASALQQQSFSNAFLGAILTICIATTPVTAQAGFSLKKSLGIDIPKFVDRTTGGCVKLDHIDVPKFMDRVSGGKIDFNKFVDRASGGRLTSNSFGNAFKIMLGQPPSMDINKFLDRASGGKIDINKFLDRASGGKFDASGIQNAFDVMTGQQKIDFIKFLDRTTGGNLDLEKFVDRASGGRIDAQELQEALHDGTGKKLTQLVYMAVAGQGEDPREAALKQLDASLKEAEQALDRDEAAVSGAVYDAVLFEKEWRSAYKAQFLKDLTVQFPDAGLTSGSLDSMAETLVNNARKAIPDIEFHEKAKAEFDKSKGLALKEIAEARKALQEEAKARRAAIEAMVE